MTLSSVSSAQRESFVNGLMHSGKTCYELSAEVGISPVSGICIAKGVLGSDLYARREKKAEEALGKKLADLVASGNSARMSMTRLGLSRSYGYRIYNQWKAEHKDTGTLTDMGNGIYLLGEGGQSGNSGGELTIRAGSTPVQAAEGEVEITASPVHEYSTCSGGETVPLSSITVSFMNAEIKYMTQLSPEKSVAEIMKNIAGRE